MHFHKNPFENVVWKMVAILSRPQYVEIFSNLGLLLPQIDMNSGHVQVISHFLYYLLFDSDCVERKDLI